MTAGTRELMTRKQRRVAATRRGARWAALLLVILAVGCKGRDGAMARGPDPLIGGPGRIPPQNVPIPGTAGTKVKPDPLMSPTGRPGDRTGAGYTNDPNRWKGPYVPNTGSVPAALAGRPKDGEELKIESPGVALEPVGGMQPAADADLAAAADVQLQQLRELHGVPRGGYTFSRSENGQIVFHANVPNPATGTTSGFTGVGATPAEAVKQVLDQIKSQRGR